MKKKKEGWEPDPKLKLENIEVKRDLEIENITFFLRSEDRNDFYTEFVEVKAKTVLPKCHNYQESKLNFRFHLTKHLKKLFYSFCEKEIKKILKDSFMLVKK